MTFTIPTWLLWTLCGIGGVIAIFVVGIVVGLAILGGVLVQSLKGGIWK